MSKDHQPRDLAPWTGWYDERDPTGQRTGVCMHMVEGTRLPPAQRGFTWRLMVLTD